MADDDRVPDPRGASSVPEFIGMLNLLRSWAGDPSYRDLAKDVSHVIGGARGTVSHNTVADVFHTKRRRLDLDIVVAIVRALGLDEQAVARWRDACVAVHAAAKSGGPLAVLRQLPADLPTFTGRREVLEQLVTAANADKRTPSAIVISAIEGMAGVGKTQLAIHVGHLLVRSGRCPDLQFYVNLRGFEPDHAPSDPGDVLEDFLRQLGVPAASIPPGLQARSAMFRDRLHGKRGLLILDNAASEAQVTALLPGSPDCVVLITSRRSLTGLDGAQLYQLDVMDEAEALILLARIAGEDLVNADPAAASAVVQFCGRLPLALSMAAGRLRSRPAWSVSDLLDHLHMSRLDSLSVGGRQIRSVFELSYRDLPPPARRLFRMIALHPGPDISVHAAASLSSCTISEARTLLNLLQDEYLLQERTPRRYEFHDLIRAFGKEIVSATETDAEQRAAIDRVAGWYLHSACAARRMADPTLPPMNPVASASPVPPLVFTHGDQALAWFEIERINMVAVCSAAVELGLLDMSWQLPTAMFAFFDRRMYYNDWIRTHLDAAAAAQQLGNLEAQGRVVCNLGNAYREQNHLEKAVSEYLKALELFRQSGYRQGEAKVLGNLGSAFEHLGEINTSIDYQRQAIDLFETLSDDYGRALSLTNLGNALATAGHFEEARQSHHTAIKLFEAMGNDRGRALVLTGLGRSATKLGHFTSAVELLTEAVAIHQSLGNLHGMAVSRMALAEACVGLGDIEEARRQLESAAAIYRDEPGDSQLAEITARLKRIGADSERSARGGVG